MSIYEICVKGLLDQHWAEWFEGLGLTYEGDTTLLRGPLADEAALHGVLTKIGNLNLQLLSVNVIEIGAAAQDTSAASHPEPPQPGASRERYAGSKQGRRSSGRTSQKRPRRSES